MNKSYRIVWNRVRNCLMVVSETTKSCGKAGNSSVAVVASVAAAVMAIGVGEAQATNTDYVIPSSSHGYTHGTTLDLQTGDTLHVESNGSVGGNVTNAVTASGVVLSNTVTGTSLSILNEGSITANSTAVLLQASTVIGGISNSGIIRAVSNNTAFKLFNSTISGGITNSGSIFGASHAGVSFIHSALSGGIVNSGSIAGGNWGISLINGSSLSGGLSNSGTIQGDAQFGIGVSQSALSGGISNSGVITSSGVNGVGITVVLGTLSGGVTNSGTVQGGKNGVLITGGSLAGGISNIGLIKGVASYGIKAAFGGTVSGGLTNSGTIQGAKNGVLISASVLSGGISNSGLIQASGGAGYGVQVAQGGTLLGGITNSGSIVGSVYGIWVGAGTGPVSALSGGITNSGLIQGGDFGIYVYNSTVSGTISNSGLLTGGFAAVAVASATVTGGLNNAATGSIVGGIVGLSSVTNSGLWALQTISGGTIVGGSHVGSTIDGNYVQTNTGTLQIGVNGVNGSGTNSGNYSQLTVGGIASLIGGTVNVSMNADTAVAVGGTLSGVVTSTGNQLTASGLSITDNSALVNFVYSTTAGSLDLIAVNDPVCAATISGFRQGACQIAFDHQSIYVSNTGSIGGATTGIKVLAGAITAGGIVNAGTVVGSSYGINVLAGSVFTGNISNSGYFSSLNNAGTINGSVINSGRIANGLTNSGVMSVSGTAVLLNQGATLSGGLHNTGTIRGQVGIQVLSGLLAGGVTNSGTIWGALGTPAGIQISGGQIQGVSNSGYITGIALTNSGEIIGIRNVGSIDVITNIGGTISGNGIYNNGFIGKIDNAGLITSTGAAIQLTAGGQVFVGLSNSGTLSGQTAGVASSHATISGGIVNTGLITASGTTAQAVRIMNSTLSGGLLNSGTISGGADGILVNFSSFTGGITNSGLIAGVSHSIYIANNSVDRIVIEGTNTASFGGAVFAPNTPVTVAGGATYNLNTNFEVSNFNNQGTLIVSAASMVTPTITGNLTLGNTGTFNPAVLSQTDYTRITVSGNVSIAGQLVVDAAQIAAGALVNRSTLVGVITAGNTVNGTFAGYADNSTLYNFIPVYDGTHLNLAVQKVGGGIYDATNAMGNKAGLGAARVLDTIGDQGGMTNVMAAFALFNNEQQISNAVSQTLPVMSGATQINTLAVLSSLNRFIEARNLQRKGISSGEEMYSNSQAWIKPFGNWMSQGNQNGAYGFKGNTGGLMLGSDTNVGADTRLGVAFAWGNSSLSSNAGTPSQSQTTNLYQFIGYGSYALTDSLEANFQANGGWNSNSSNRQIGFMGTSAQGSYNSSVWHIGAGLANPFQVTEDTQLIPSARFDYSWVRNSAYNETGATNGLGLNVQAQTYQSSVLSADGKVVHKLTDQHSINANLGVGYNFSPTQTNVAASFQGASTLQFTTNGVNPGATMGRAGVGYSYKVKQNVDVGIRYDIDFQNSYTNQTATAKARWMF